MQSNELEVKPHKIFNIFKTNKPFVCKARAHARASVRAQLYFSISKISYQMNLVIMKYLIKSVVKLTKQVQIYVIFTFSKR